MGRLLLAVCCLLLLLVVVDLRLRLLFAVCCCFLVVVDLLLLLAARGCHWFACSLFPRYSLHKWRVFSSVNQCLFCHSSSSDERSVACAIPNLTHPNRQKQPRQEGLDASCVPAARLKHRPPENGWCALDPPPPSNPAHAHRDLDVYNRGAPHLPKNAATTKEERESFGEWMRNGKVSDAFRRLHPQADGAYTYWSVRANNVSELVSLGAGMYVFI